MRRKEILLCPIVLAAALTVWAPGARAQDGVSNPTQNEIAANKRVRALLEYPTFIRLRLASSRRFVPQEDSTDTPAPYKVKDWIGFQLFITQNSPENIVLWSSVDPYCQTRPELMRDGEIVPYNKKAQKEAESDERRPPSGSGAPITLEPGREITSNPVNLDDWYDPLAPGRYKLTVRKRFVWQGDWVASNAVYFEVVARSPAAIPAGVTIEMVPDGSEPITNGKPYPLRSDDSIRVFILNYSEQPLKMSVVDRYYGCRPQLFKDGLLIPYRQETESLIKSKDENPRLVEIANDFLIDPGPRSSWTYIKLSEWYGPLKPGTYRLINRGRFEIDGPWTADSTPFLFEVLPANKK